jgi:hypothetical protein
VTVALLEPTDPSHALHPANDSEHLLFRNLTDNLIRLDCRGNVRAGLAETWEPESELAAWILTLRDNARLRSGAPISASQVVSALRQQLSSGPPGIDSAVALNGHQLRIFGSGDSVLRALADPALALVDSAALHGMNDESDIQLPGTGPDGVIEFREIQSGDARDALEGGADIVIASSTSLREYAEGRPEFASFPLPWSGSYVLLQPRGVPPLRIRGLDSRSLARDAVEADAQAADSLGWLNQAGSCPHSHPTAEPAASGRIVYEQGDAVARALAERMVAIAEPGKGWRTLEMVPAELANSLERGSESAYVLAVPRQTHAPCRESAGWPAGAQVWPLIETRAHAIVRKGAPPLAVEWDGTVRFPGP